MAKRQRTSQELLMARHKREKQEHIGRITGGMDHTEAQWWKLQRELGQVKPSYLIRWVEFSNQIPSGLGTLNRYDRSKVFLSRVYFINAIEMILKGYNKVTTYDAEMAAMHGMTEEEYAASQCDILDDFFSALPPLPSTR